MKKLVKYITVMGMTGALLASNSMICSAEDSETGFLTSIVNDVLSNVTMDDLGLILDSYKAITEDEEVMNAVHEFLELKEVRSVLDMAATALHNIPEEKKAEVLSYLAPFLMDGQIGLSDGESNVTELDIDELPDDMQKLTEEEAKELNLIVYPSEDMYEPLYLVTEDEEVGTVYSALFSTDTDSYSYYMFSTDESDLSAVEYDTLTDLIALIQGAETTTEKVGDFDAEAVIPTSGQFGKISWIDKDAGMYYRFEASYYGEGDEPVYTAEGLAELAVSLTMAE